MVGRRKSHIQEAAERYLVDRSPEHRDRLVELLLPWIKSLAAQQKRRIFTALEQEDLVQHGVIGLIDALTRYKGQVRVQTFALQRVVGAMIDAARAHCPLSRLQMKRFSRLNATALDLAQQLGRRPSNGEIEDAAQVRPREAAELRQCGTLVTPADVTPRREDCGAAPIDGSSEDPARIERRRALVRILLRSLETRERICFTEYYFAEKTMAAIARGMDLSESRVSQMMSAAIERLRERFDDEKAELFELARAS